MQTVPMLLLKLLLLLRTTTLALTAGEGVTVDIPAGVQFAAGGTIVIGCRAFGVAPSLAIRLFCPLGQLAGSSSATTACFEDCSPPLCAGSFGQAFCRGTIPELLSDGACRQTERRLTPDGSYDVSFAYYFQEADRLRHGGNYTCQYKQMRSTKLITVDAATTTSTTISPSTTSTTPSTTTSSTTPSTTTSSTTPSTTTSSTTTTTSTTTTASTTSSSATTKSTDSTAPRSSMSIASLITTTPMMPLQTSEKVISSTTATSARAATEQQGSSPSNTRLTSATTDNSRATTHSSTRLETSPVPNDWFNTELLSSLTNGHVLILAVSLLIVLILSVIIALLCWRGCLNRDRGKGHKPEGRRQPPLGRASIRGSFEDAAGAEEMLPFRNYQNQQQQRPPPLPTSSRPNSQSFASQIYNEAEPTLPSAASNGSVYYVRPNAATMSAASGAAAAVAIGGGSSFFSRAQDGRHSFHSVRHDSRQRINRIGGGGGGAVGGGSGYPGTSDSAELLSGGRGAQGGGLLVGVNVPDGGGVGGFPMVDGMGYVGVSGGGDTQMQDVVRLLTEQSREIQRLHQQVRASNQALSRLAASYQDLHRSVSLSRVRHPSCSPRNSPVGRQAAAATPDSSGPEDPYEPELLRLMLPSPATVAAEAAAMTAAAIADDADDGLEASHDHRGSTAVDTISEELEGEDTLRPRKQQQLLQKQQN